MTGPSRSGKSEWAENLAAQTGKPVIYVATAQADPHDLEWTARLEKHQQRRPSSWETLLVPVELAATIREHSLLDCCLLIDSLGTWVANLLVQETMVWQETVEKLRESLLPTNSTIILVAEETGWGVVPAYPLGRKFRDRLGDLIRELGIMANPVYLVTGGHVLNLSQLGVPLPESSETPPIN